MNNRYGVVIRYSSTSARLDSWTQNFLFYNRWPLHRINKLFQPYIKKEELCNIGSHQNNVEDQIRVSIEQVKLTSDILMCNHTHIQLSIEPDIIR
mgnify:FL=1